MKVTDMQIPFDKRLYNKLVLMVNRFKIRKDALLLVDGAEGDGKSTIAAGCSKVIAYLLGRDFTVENCFFNIEEMINFASTHNKKIIWWDEAALGGLKREWNTEYQLKLIQLLAVGRKKGHFYIINIPRLKNLKQDIVDRAVGLIHVYSPDQIEIGRFAYYKKNDLDQLYEKYQSSRKVLYKNYYSFIGRFSDYIEKYKVIDPEIYGAKKDVAIASLAKDKEKVNKKEILLQNKLNDLRKRILNLPLKQIEIAKGLGFDRSTITKWKDMQPYVDVDVESKSINNKVVNFG